MGVPPFPAATFELPFYYVLVALLAIAMLISFGAMRSKFGLSLAAIRGDEDKARGIGVRTFGVKVLAFSVSVGLTAMVGGVWAYYEGYIYPQFAVDPLVTIAIVLMTFLGGRATLWGPVIGALLLETTQQTLAYSLGGSQFYLIAYAWSSSWSCCSCRRGSCRRSRTCCAAGVAAPPWTPAGRRDDGSGADTRLGEAGGRLERGGGSSLMAALLEVDRSRSPSATLRAVDSASFTVEDDSITALIGPNGSGKTTVFNMITGYLSPDAGRVRFDGRDITGASAGTLVPSRTDPDLPAGPGLPAAHRRGEPDRGGAGTRGDSCSGTGWVEQTGSGSPSCWRSSGWRTSPTSTPPSCPTASASSWSSRPC